MKIGHFDVYEQLLKEKSGLVLTPDKSYLLESRLGPIAKKWGFSNLEAMTINLQGMPDPTLINDVVEAMTTNETSFFRDSRPFDLLRDYTLPFMIEKKADQKKLNIWCAAASSGQEPYSISMVIKETGPKMAGWTTKILATDISNEILEQARQGRYSQFEVQRGLPVQLLMKYFTQEDNNKWQIKDEIRQMVQYQHLNLLNSITGLGKFDIVFCRNVLIYFDEATKADILKRIAAQLEPDGILYLGGAETVLGITESFKPIPGKRGIYAMPGSVHLDAPESPARETLASGPISA